MSETVYGAYTGEPIWPGHGEWPGPLRAPVNWPCYANRHDLCCGRVLVYHGETMCGCDCHVRREGAG